MADGVDFKIKAGDLHEQAPAFSFLAPACPAL
jgi:hypothetical protein